MGDNIAINANIELAKNEARYYDKIHSEIFNKHEQKRLWKQLKDIVPKLAGKRALDVGAGTGNVSIKLLELGMDVTALDVGKEYLDVLHKKCPNIKIICDSFENADFEKESFDLITFYSTLHHFQDYELVLKKAIGLLKKNGLLYIDHEALPCKENKLYDFTNGALNVIKVCWLGGIKRKDIKFDYSKADYHSFVDIDKLEKILTENMNDVTKIKYIHRVTHYWNPLSLFFKRRMLLWIARK